MKNKELKKQMIESLKQLEETLLAAHNYIVYLENKPTDTRSKAKGEGK